MLRNGKEILFFEFVLASLYQHAILRIDVFECFKVRTLEGDKTLCMN